MKLKIKPNQIERSWYFIDAKNKVLGKVCTQIAKILQGKNRPYYAPFWDMGDYVVVVNADKIVVTGKKEKEKFYYHHSGFPGGLKKESLGELRIRKPEEIIRRAVKGMMPKNRLAREMMKKLYIYKGGKHPYKEKEFKKLEI